MSIEENKNNESDSDEFETTLQNTNRNSRKVSQPPIKSIKEKLNTYFFYDEEKQNNLTKSNNEQKETSDDIKDKLLRGNIYSPTKKFIKNKISLLKKLKKKSNEKKNFEIKEDKDDHIRRDVNGTPINKFNKGKVKVSFCDTVFKGKKNLVEIIDIPSYKEYNYLGDMPNNSIVINQVTCNCCTIY